jgi:hypothetical protein
MDGYRTQSNDVKNRYFILVSAGMVLPAAFLFYVVAELPHVFIVACIGFAVSLLIRKPLKYTDRSIIYTVVVALILVVLLDLVFPMKQDRFFHIGKIFRPNITVPLAIYLAVFATFYESSKYTLGFNSAFSLIAILLGGDYRMAGSALPVTGLFGFLLSKNNFTPFFMTVCTINVIMILIGFNMARKSLFHKSNFRFDVKKNITTGIAVLVSALLASGLLFLFQTYRREIMRFEQYIRYLTYKNYRNPSGVMFDREIDLNTTIRANRHENSKQIMLRVSGCDTPPGYLRGRVYQFYSNGRWRETAENPGNTNFKINLDGLAINAFFIGKDPGSEGESINIYPASRCYAKFLFLPGNTKRIEMVADKVEYTKNGHFIPKLWEKDGGYTAKVEAVDQFAAFAEPEQFVLAQYLPVPSNLSDKLDSIIEEIYGPVENEILQISNTPDPTDSEIIKKTVNYFQTKFQYTLEPEIPLSDEEPLENFMLRSRKGHCELFASSTAMILRKRGIPTRYVTGFVCHEEHPSGEYFVSRLGDAHAWVEAYLRDEQKWVVVEPTPASSEDPESKWGFFEVWSDRLKQAFQKIFADIRRGYVARAVLSGVMDIVNLFWDFIRHPVRGTIFICIILFLFWRHHFHKKKRHKSALSLDANIIEIQKKIGKIEQYFTKKTGIARDASVTLEEWLNKIGKTDAVSNENFSKLVELLKLYHQLRFSTEPVSNKQIKSLESLADNCK